MTEAQQSRMPPARIAFSFPAQPESIGEIRHLIVSEASALPFSAEELDDIALAVSETFTNLVQHARGYRIRGTSEISPRGLDVRFELEQKVNAFTELRQLPGEMAHSGRGIPLLQMLIPTVEIHERADGITELRLVKPVRDAEEPR